MVDPSELNMTGHEVPVGPGDNLRSEENNVDEEVHGESGSSKSY